MIGRRALLKSAAAAGGVLAVRRWTAPARAVAAASYQTDQLVVGISTDPVTLDTRQSQNTTGVSQIDHILEPLVLLNPDTGKLVGVLAESWEPTSSGWRLHLRRGVRFHNGQEFTAEDAKYTLDSIVDPANVKWVQPTIRGKMQRLARVEVQDRYTCTLDTGGFSRAFLSTLTQVGIVPASAAAEGPRFAQNPIGTGPYRYVEFIPGEHLTVEANPDYWQKGLPKTRRLTFRILPENETRLAALESGEVSYINNVPPDAIARIKRRSDLDVVTQTTTRFVHIQMVNDHKPFDNRNVRLAVNYAIDKDGIWRGIMGGLGQITTAPWPSNMLGFNSQLKPYPYDPSRAKRLLDEAGVSSVRIKYGGPNGRYLNDKQVSEAVITQLQAVGIAADVDIREFGAFFQNVFARRYDAFLLGYSYAGLDPDNAREFWSSKSSLADYKNPEVDRLFAQGDATSNLTVAADVYRRLAAIVWNDVPYAWMYYQPDISGVNRRLRGWTPRKDELVYFTSAWLA
jgi:peptide/nickel transport system substrate-binding protein